MVTRPLLMMAAVARLLFCLLPLASAVTHHLPARRRKHGLLFSYPALTPRAPFDLDYRGGGPAQRHRFEAPERCHPGTVAPPGALGSSALRRGTSRAKVIDWRTALLRGSASHSTSLSSGDILGSEYRNSTTSEKDDQWFLKELGLGLPVPATISSAASSSGSSNTRGGSRGPVLLRQIVVAIDGLSNDDPRKVQLQRYFVKVYLPLVERSLAPLVDGRSDATAGPPAATTTDCGKASGSLTSPRRLVVRSEVERADAEAAARAVGASDDATRVWVQEASLSRRSHAATSHDNGGDDAIIGDALALRSEIGNNNRYRSALLRFMAPPPIIKAVASVCRKSAAFLPRFCLAPSPTHVRAAVSSFTPILLLGFAKTPLRLPSVSAGVVAAAALMARHEDVEPPVGRPTKPDLRDAPPTCSGPRVAD
eukprot:GHVU01232268.1.p1 GENE.GHVU01232268.1~~GHVU01232268.1.p1  ORF type:complete len:424 (-),score=21.40 GHVU01232268.1:393-1664(-)